MACTCVPPRAGATEGPHLRSLRAGAVRRASCPVPKDHAAPGRRAAAKGPHAAGRPAGARTDRRIAGQTVAPRWRIVGWPDGLVPRTAHGPPPAGCGQPGGGQPARTAHRPITRARLRNFQAANARPLPLGSPAAACGRRAGPRARLQSASCRRRYWGVVLPVRGGCDRERRERRDRPATCALFACAQQAPRGTPLGALTDQTSRPGLL